MDGTRWTRKTTQAIAEALFQHGIEVSANTVRRLLHAMGFSLKTNRKNIESGFKRKHGDRARRNRQFMAIAPQRRKFETADLPIISIDGKKRELIGNVKNGARTWRRKARETPSLPSTPSNSGGAATARSTTPEPLKCSSSPTPAEPRLDAIPKARGQ